MVTPDTHGVAALREFVALQASLLRALHVAHSALTPHDLDSIPRSGKLDMPSGTWTFQRHGAGVSFKRERDGCIVDVHARAQEPNTFDAWRLETYFASLGRSGMKRIDKACGTRNGSARQKVALWLQQLEDRGAIRKVDGAFVLREDETQP